MQFSKKKLDKSDNLKFLIYLFKITKIAIMKLLNKH